MKKMVAVLLFGFYHAVIGQTAGELLQTKLNAMHTLKASFSQVVKANARSLSHSSGKMALQRPGRFRWEVESPMEQLVVADGKKMWVYDKELEQVTVKNQEQQMGGAAALFLSGSNESLSRDFEVVQKKHKKELIFHLKAKSVKANFQKVKLTFYQDQLIALELLDQLGQTTFVKLNKGQSNLKLSPDLFQFKVPKGVDVVYQ